jgi:signal transduction histidine kinase
MRRSVAPPPVHLWAFTAGGRRRTAGNAAHPREASYTSLPSPRYRFHAVAANDGVSSTAGASLDCTIERASNQTWWLFGLVTTAIALAPAGAAVVWQCRRGRLAAERAQTRFDAMLAERTRVARELHDTLLSDLAGVAMQLKAGARRAKASGGDASAVVELLSELSAQVQRTHIEARHSVTAMRTAPAALPPLHERLVDAARRTFAETGISARVEHAGFPRPYAPAVESDILGIATEAMTNAREHAVCRTVTVTCSYAPRSLRVRVRDDGRGFDASQATPTGHWGMIGMRERAESIGATLAVTTAPGAGTEVTIDVPGEEDRRTWWARALSFGRG